VCHVVRCFDNADITDVEGSVDPIRDIEIINLELVMADLQSVENRITKVERKALNKEKEAVQEYRVLKAFQEALIQGKPARSVEIDKEDLQTAKNYQLLTHKPMIYIANMAEDEVADPENNKYYMLVKEFAEAEGNDVIAISARIEEELSMMEKEDRQMFLEDLGIKESGLDQVIRAAYHLLGLKTYFTAGQPEVRAWTFKDGMTAPECAGIIHSDFQRGFIRAEAYSYDDIVTYGSEAALKENGKLRSEGKDYIVKDGDVLHFRFNV
jgi:GTP-binding protein YchF